MIGAGALALLGEKRVQRVDPERGVARAARGFGEFRERGEIADALVAVAAQAVELGAQSGGAGVKRRRPVTGARRDGQMADAYGIVGERELIAADGERRQRRDLHSENAAVTGAPVFAPERLRLEAAAGAAFVDQLQFRAVGVHGQRRLDACALADDQSERQRAAVARDGEAFEARARLALGVGRQAHGLEQGALGRLGNDMARPVDVMPVRREACGARERVERLGLRRRVEPRCADPPRVSTSTSEERGAIEQGLAAIETGVVARAVLRLRVERAAPEEIVARLRQAERRRVTPGVEQDGGARSVGVEEGGEETPLAILPLPVAQDVAVGAAPFDIGEAAIGRRAGQETILREGRIVPPQRDQRAREIDERAHRPCPSRARRPHCPAHRRCCCRAGSGRVRRPSTASACRAPAAGRPAGCAGRAAARARMASSVGRPSTPLFQE